MGSGAWSKIFVLNPCSGEHSSLLCIQGQAIRQAKNKKGDDDGQRNDENA